MSPLRGMCSESPSPWGRLAFPRLFPLTPESRRCPVFPPTPLPPCPHVAASLCPSVAGAAPSASTTHLLPCLVVTQGPRGRRWRTNGKASSLCLHTAPRRPRAPDPRGLSGRRLLRLTELASRRLETQHLAENPGNSGPCGRSPQSVVIAVAAQCHILCGGKVILSPAKMKN